MALEAAYAFNDVSGTTVLDLSGNGRHITLTGTNGAQVAGGNPGGALGKTGAVMPQLPSSVVAACLTDDRTIMFDALGARVTWWIRFWDGAASGIWGVLDLDGALMRGQARTAPGDVLQSRPTAPAPEAVTWRNYCLTYERATGLLTLYRDGTQTGQVDLADGTQLSVNADRIDLAEWSTAGPAMDNLRLYSHALTPIEVNDIAGTPVEALAEDATLAATLLLPTFAGTAGAVADTSLAATLPPLTASATAESNTTATLATTLPKPTFTGTAAAPTAARGLSLVGMSQAILGAVQDHFADAGVSLPERQYIAPGDPLQIAWDCEQLVVAIQGVGFGQAPGASTPSPKMGSQISATGMRHAIFVVSLVRCTPSEGDPNTGLPHVVDIHAAGLEYMRDMGLLSQALVVACARVRAGLSRSALVEAGAVNPAGPSGGFHGMDAQIAITAGELI